jgi:hypothetical protein
MSFRRGQIFRIITLSLILFACKKEHTPPTDTPPPPPPPAPVKKVLLKDITIPHLPSPYYHFEYNSDSLVNKVDYSSGYTIYDVIYNGSKIAEMRNNILVNHDTLRYTYDSAGKLALIKFINDANVVYRLVRFAYNGDQVREIAWDQREGNVGFLTDRTLTFAYHPDGNVKTITEHRPAQTGSPEFTIIRQFEQYDDKINVDDFSLIHDGIHDHLFLFQGFRLQKNNPGKETYSGGVVTLSYSVDYTYTYNSDNTPSKKSGDLLFTAGIDSGKRFQTESVYSYY